MTPPIPESLREQLIRTLSPERCPICFWPWAGDASQGCVPDNCSYRTDDRVEQENAKERRGYFEDVLKQLVPFVQTLLAAQLQAAAEKCANSARVITEAIELGSYPPKGEVFSKSVEDYCVGRAEGLQEAVQIILALTTADVTQALNERDAKPDYRS